MHRARYMGPYESVVIRDLDGLIAKNGEILELPDGPVTEGLVEAGFEFVYDEPDGYAGCEL